MSGILAAQAEIVIKTPNPLPKLCRDERIAVIGLGYVGLPVSVALASKYADVVGFDIDRSRIERLCECDDWTHEVSTDALAESPLQFTAEDEQLAGRSIYVVAVPTPVDADNRPDFEPLLSTCRRVARHLTRGAIVIFESTVHPGATEEICAPELERFSAGLKAGIDFHVAYSPERISPGDPVNRLDTIAKIVSADCDAALDRVAAVYERIIGAGVHRTRSIKVAEAAKVFENTQRDVNIALMNEMALICDKLGIRTRDVVAATQTKWNALPFKPGLVGGHCIGVDPHYLAAKAESLGIHPELIRASRRRNDAVPNIIAEKTVRFLAQQGGSVTRQRVGILGLTFKEDVPDLRNSRVFDLIEALEGYGVRPLVHDPLADRLDAQRQGVTFSELSEMKGLDVLIVAVPHASYLADGGISVPRFIRPGGFLLDVKSVFNPDALRPDLKYWSL